MKYKAITPFKIRHFLFIFLMLALTGASARAAYLTVTSREAALSSALGGAGGDAKAFRGDIIQTLQTQDGWYKVVLRNGATGWLPGWCVSEGAAGTPMPGIPALWAPTMENPRPAWVVSTDVTFRTEPRADLPAKIDHTRAGTLSYGSLVWVIGRKGHWAQIYISSVFSGWVYDEALSPAPGTVAPVATPAGYPTRSDVEGRFELTFPMDRPAPFVARPLPFLGGIEVLFFGISCPQGQQPAGDTSYRFACFPEEKAAQVVVNAPDGRLAGYDVKWVDGAFRIQMRRAPHGRPLTIVLDPGHGAPEPPPRGFAAGAQSKSGLREKDVNLDIALRMRDVLIAAGNTVILTRTGDSLDMLDIYRRTDLAEQTDPDIFISIHGNGDTDRSISGPEVYWYDPQSEPLAKIMADALGVPTGRLPGKALFGSLGVIRYTAAPAVLIEMGYLTNNGEAALLAKPEFRQKCAETAARAIASYVEYLDGR